VLIALEVEMERNGLDFGVIIEVEDVFEVIIEVEGVFGVIIVPKVEVGAHKLMEQEHCSVGVGGALFRIENLFRCIHFLSRFVMELLLLKLNSNPNTSYLLVTSDLKALDKQMLNQTAKFVDCGHR